MARRAVWRAQKGDPRTPLGWALRDDGARWLPLPWAVVLMAAAGALAVGWSAWALLLVPAIALHVRRPAHAPDGLDALETVPAPGPAFRVHLEVLEGEAVSRGFMLGADDGIVTFVEGWLHFVGRRTEFAFRRADAAQVVQWSFGQGVLLRNAYGISLAPFADVEEGTLLRAALDAWFRDPFAAEGESILPPSTIHASGLVRAWRDALGTTTSWVVGAIALAHWISSVGWFAFAPVSVETYRRLGRALKLSHQAKRAFPNERRLGLGP